jgi:hypothetical protein
MARLTSPADSTFRPKYADEMSKQAKKRKKRAGKEVGEKWKNNFSRGERIVPRPTNCFNVHHRARPFCRLREAEEEAVKITGAIRHTEDTRDESASERGGAMWVNEPELTSRRESASFGKRCC